MVFDVFISYAHQDQEFCSELQKHLSNLKRQGIINAWYDGDISPGVDWKRQIISRIDTAQIIFLLISADFMASDFSYSIEMEQAIARHDAGQARVIPIILRPTDWSGAPFAKLKVLPSDDKAITKWATHDEAFEDIVKGIRVAVDDLTRKGVSSSDSDHARAGQNDTQNFLGESHAKLTAWLSQTWLTDGPPICFIQGFPGVGKTFLARNLMKNLNIPRIIVTMPGTESNQVDDLFLDMATELDLIGFKDMAYAVDSGTSLPLALEKILRKQVLIVVDEFQQALDRSGRPISKLAATLDRIANRSHFPGRMLLLSNHIVERSKWSEAYALRTLAALNVEDAERLLDTHLKEIDRSAEVPFERRRDVVNWLGRNPRAIHVLVSSLEYDSLDDLIGLNPESWDLREREVSPELLYRLEHELLERTLSHLKAETSRLLSRLSVYRKPIKRKGIEVLLPDRTDIAGVRDDLISRFLMEHHSGSYTLHPIVKEISLQGLKGNVSELRQAHAKAAGYYTRHFTAKNIVGNGQLGGYFVEARYHLVQAKREKDLTGIAERFGNHLKSSFKTDFSLLTGQDERDETIAVLSALLDSMGDRDLEYYLASLYNDRRAANDLPMALIYATRATGIGARTNSWKLRIQLEMELNGLESALQVFREGIDRIHAGRLVDFYQQCGQVLAQLLARAKRSEEAITLLKEGIERFPTDLYAIALYRQCGELLVGIGKPEEAISLLREGIACLPTGGGQVGTLYRQCGELLVEVDELEEGIAVLREGIACLPTTGGQVGTLYQSYGELLVKGGKPEEAITVLREGIARLPADGQVVALYRSYSGLLVRTGKPEEAITVLREGIARLPTAGGHVVALYQSYGELLVAAGKPEEAISLLQEGIARLPTGGGEMVALYRQCAELLVEAGKREEAITVLQEGIVRLPIGGGEVVALYQSQEEILGRIGKREEAISLLQEGIVRLPADGRQVVRLYQSYGELLAQVGKSEEAIVVLQEGIDRLLNMNTFILYQSWAEILAQAGRLEEGIAVLQEGIAHLPNANRALLYQSWAEILARVGRLEEGIAVLQEGIAHLSNANRALLYQSWAEILARVGRLEEGIAVLQEGIARLPLGKNRTRLSAFLSQFVAS